MAVSRPRAAMMVVEGSGMEAKLSIEPDTFPAVAEPRTMLISSVWPRMKAKFSSPDVWVQPAPLSGTKNDVLVPKAGKVSAYCQVSPSVRFVISKNNSLTDEPGLMVRSKEN